jgi:hypothetical protein
MFYPAALPGGQPAQEEQMNVASIRQANHPAGSAWSELGKDRTAPAGSLAWLVLPLSLLPPAVLAYAAAGHPLLQAAAAAPWERIAVAFVVAEMVAFAGMGWLIRTLGARYKIDVGWRDAYLLAAVCPVPMWLSSLGLLVDNIGVSLAIGLAGMWLSEALAFRQSYALGRGSGRGEAEATGFAASVVGARLVAWALLLMLVAVLA